MKSKFGLCFIRHVFDPQNVQFERKCKENSCTTRSPTRCFFFLPFRSEFGAQPFQQITEITKTLCDQHQFQIDSWVTRNGSKIEITVFLLLRSVRFLCGQP